MGIRYNYTHTNQHGATMEQELYTRKQYMNDSTGPDARSMEAHRKYYAQFVDERVINQVVRHIGAEAIKASTDPHMNDIPLNKWDRLHGYLTPAIPLKSVGEAYCLSTTVCIAKEAARQYKERN